MKTHRLSIFALLVLAAGVSCFAAAEPIIIGQSLPLAGAGFPVANRVLAGSKTIVDKINASGGVAGRKIELVTLNDAGDPKTLAINLRALVKDRGAVAIVNCIGEKACLSTSDIARELGVPLIGPMSGARLLRSSEVSHVYTTRPDDLREASTLVRQLQSMGISRALFLTDRTESMRTDALIEAMKAADLRYVLREVDETPSSLRAGLSPINANNPQALILHVGHGVLDTLDRLPVEIYEAAPSTVVTFSSNGLTQLTRLFRNRLIGYTSVVPNPEDIKHEVVREFLKDVEEFNGPEAVSFEGFEAYINLRLCIEVLKRAGPKGVSKGLPAAVEQLGVLELGGIRMAFDKQKHHGSDFVEIGIRARDGRLLR